MTRRHDEQVERLEKEFSALKGRGGEARTQAYDKGKAEAINNILGVADNFERAAGAISAETDGERAVVAYYKDTYDNMMKCLEGLDLTEVDTVRGGLGRRGGERGLCQASSTTLVHIFLLWMCRLARLQETPPLLLVDCRENRAVYADKDTTLD